MRSLRYYEDQGLLKPKRTDNGYREYEESDVDWVKTIQLFLSMTFETNFFGVIRLIQESIPLMKKQGYGRIVNLSSGLGAFEILEGLGGLKGSSAAYRISKTMLNALTCLVAQEVKESGIKVNAVCPGRVQTDMGGADAPSTVEEGAETAIWLATLDNDGPTGGFFRDRQRIAW